MMDKKKIARQVAAKHHADAVQAVMEYAQETNQVEHMVEDFDAVRDEMMDLLEPYRYPAVSREQEIFLFYNPGALPEVSMTAYTDPPFIVKLKQAGMDPELIDEINNHVTKSSQEIVHLRGELHDYKKRLSEIEPLYQAAAETYGNGKRGSAIYRALGFTKGTRGRVYDEFKIYLAYLKLIREQGMSRRDALKKTIGNGGPMQGISDKSASKNLRTSRDNIQKRLEISDTIVARRFKKALAGFVITYFPE